MLQFPTCETIFQTKRTNDAISAMTLSKQLRALTLKLVKDGKSTVSEAGVLQYTVYHSIQTQRQRMIIEMNITSHKTLRCQTFNQTIMHIAQPSDFIIDIIISHHYSLTDTAGVVMSYYFTT